MVRSAATHETMLNEQERRSVVGLVYRLTAIFFLVFTLVDLTIPGVCAEEGLGLARVASADRSAAVMRSPDPVVGRSGSATPSDGAPETLDEDCFCCCSYLVATPPFSFDTEQLDPPIYEASLMRLPTSPPRKLDDPPRLA